MLEPTSEERVPDVKPNTRVLYEYTLRAVDAQRADTETLDRKVQMTFGVISLLASATILTVPTQMSVAEAVLHCSAVALAFAAVYQCIRALEMRSFSTTGNLEAIRETMRNYDETKTMEQLMSNLIANEKKHFETNEQKAGHLRKALNELLIPICFLIFLIVTIKIILFTSIDGSNHKPKEYYVLQLFKR